MFIMFNMHVCVYAHVYVHACMHAWEAPSHTHPHPHPPTPISRVGLPESVKIQ